MQSSLQDLTGHCYAARRYTEMPVRTVRISNLSGAVIPDGTGARVRVMWANGQRLDMRMDLTDEEAAKLAKAYKADEVDPRPDRRMRR
jgi:hypothetical protein